VFNWLSIGTTLPYVYCSLKKQESSLPLKLCLLFAILTFGLHVVCLLLCTTLEMNTVIHSIEILLHLWGKAFSVSTKVSDCKLSAPSDKRRKGSSGRVFTRRRYCHCDSSLSSCSRIIVTSGSTCASTSLLLRSRNTDGP
jgi:hypothetical protein